MLKAKIKSPIIQFIDQTGTAMESTKEPTCHPAYGRERL